MTRVISGTAERTSRSRPLALAFVGGLLAVLALLVLLQQFGVSVVDLPLALLLSVATGVALALTVRLVARSRR